MGLYTAYTVDIHRITLQSTSKPSFHMWVPWKGHWPHVCGVPNWHVGTYLWSLSTNWRAQMQDLVTWAWKRGSVYNSTHRTYPPTHRKIKVWKLKRQYSNFARASVLQWDLENTCCTLSWKILHAFKDIPGHRKRYRSGMILKCAVCIPSLLFCNRPGKA